MIKITRAIYVIGILCLLVIPLMTVSCGNATTPDADETGKILVVTSSFPLYDFARIIGGEQAEVVLLTPPGLSPHSFEPTPKHLEIIESADMFVYSGAGLEPWVEDVLAGVENRELLVVNAAEGVTLMKIGDMDVHEHDEDIDDHDTDMDEHVDDGDDTASEGHADEMDEHSHDHGSYDPHYWLDFENARVQVDNILGGYLQIDSEHADLYLERTDGYTSTIKLLDQMYRDALAECPDGELVSAGHFAFGYMAHRYGLHHRAVFGALHDAEPSPRDLAEMVDYITEHNIKYIVGEEMIDPKIARTVSGETGAEIVTLNPAGNISKDQMEAGVTFVDLMQENLKSLKMIVGCE